MSEEQYQLEEHFVNRSNWLRAAVLGANDGILSTASIAVGVAAATGDRDSIVIASLAGLVAGALSMAAGEYVSVSSQSDLEQADLERERQELERMPEIEMNELAKIYVRRGLKPDTAQEVARQLHEHNALEAHARDELGITDLTAANPLQAAFSSGLAFTIGGLLPMLVALFFPVAHMVYYQYGMTIAFLAIAGALGARAGRAPLKPAIIRITFWGTVAMGITGAVGHLFNIAV